MKTGERPKPPSGERAAPATGERAAPLIGERVPPAMGERVAPEIGLRAAPEMGERVAPEIGERVAPLIGERLESEGVVGLEGRTFPSTGPRTRGCAVLPADRLGAAPGLRSTREGDRAAPLRSPLLGLPAERGVELRRSASELGDCGDATEPLMFPSRGPATGLSERRVMLGVLAADGSTVRGLLIGRSSVEERSGVRAASGRLRPAERSPEELEAPLRGWNVLEGRWVGEGEEGVNVERGSERMAGESERGENDRLTEGLLGEGVYLGVLVLGR